tara:strand:- start:1605 stop:3164 length:1560 start_codon:yes stop_codon:yes gene_type:complete
MFRRPQPENFVNYQVQASLGRQPTSGKIPIKRRKKTRIKKRKDSFQLRAQDIDKRRSVYRPDRLLALHQSALTNATRTAQEMERGLTAIGTTIGLERQQIKDADVEKAKGRVLLALANKLESKEPFINVGYTQHRLPDDLNSVRLPDRPQAIKELGYREPREEPKQETTFKTSYSSHRLPNDDNSNLLEPLLTEISQDTTESEGEADIEELLPTPTPERQPTPIPRVEKPSVGKLDPTRGLQLEEKIIKDGDKNADVEALRQQAKEQREKARQTQTQTNEPQLRPPEPQPEPEPVPEPQSPVVSQSIYEQWKQSGVVNRGDGDNPPAEVGPFAPPDVEPTRTIPKVRENIQAPPTAQQQAQLDAAEESKRKRQEKLKQKFGELKEDINKPVEQPDSPEPEPEPIQGEVQDITDVIADDFLTEVEGAFSGGKLFKKTGNKKQNYQLDPDQQHYLIELDGTKYAVIEHNPRKGNILLQTADTINIGDNSSKNRKNIKKDKLLKLIQAGDVPLQKISSNYKG